MSFKVGDYILTNDEASKGRVYEIIKKHGEHYKLKSNLGVRFCREWRIERMATDKEIKQGYRDE